MTEVSKPGGHGKVDLFLNSKLERLVINATNVFMYTSVDCSNLNISLGVPKAFRKKLQKKFETGDFFFFFFGQQL